MSILYFPNMWMSHHSLLPSLASASQERGIDLATFQEAHSRGDIDRSLEEGEKLMAHPACTDEMRAMIILENATALSEEPDIVSARMLASQGVGEAVKRLGSTHPLTMELRRRELHWMCFTLMEDIAIRRYRKFLKDAARVWGKETPKYWLCVAESLIPLSQSGAFYPVARRLESLQKGIGRKLGETHLLRYAAGVAHVQHYLSVANLDAAQAAIHTMSTWAHAPLEASGHTSCGRVSGEVVTADDEDDACACAWRVIALTLAFLSSRHGSTRHANRYLNLAEKGLAQSTPDEIIRELSHLLPAIVADCDQSAMAS